MATTEHYSERDPRDPLNASTRTELHDINPDGERAEDLRSPYSDVARTGIRKEMCRIVFGSIALSVFIFLMIAIYLWHERNSKIIVMLALIILVSAVMAIAGKRPSSSEFSELLSACPQ